MRCKKKKVLLTDEKNNKVFSVDGYGCHLEMYGTRVDVVFGQREKIKKFSERNAKSGGFVHSTCSNDHLVWLRSRKNIENVAHESYHLMNRMSKDLGFSDDYNNEQQAYLLADIFGTLRKL